MAILGIKCFSRMTFTISYVGLLFIIPIFGFFNIITLKEMSTYDVIKEFRVSMVTECVLRCGNHSDCIGVTTKEDGSGRSGGGRVCVLLGRVTGCDESSTETNSQVSERVS